MPIGSHIIPRFYLEQFAVPSNRKNRPGRVWVYEKNKDPQQRSTKAQGYENGYFGFVRPDGSMDESLEHQLAKLEAECNDVLVCAKSDLFDWTSTAYKRKLAFYAALLFQRATQHRNANLLNWTKVQEEFTKVLADETFLTGLAMHYSKKSAQTVTTKDIRFRLGELSKKLKKPSDAKNVFLQELLTNAEYFKNVLLEKPWQV